MLNSLREKSVDRLAVDPDFEYVREDIALYRKYLADKSVSLNMAERRLEKEKLEARIETRKKEREARPPGNEKIYEITLKQAGLPGLPSPTSVQELGASEPDSRSISEEGDDAELKGPVVDADLKETKRILLDYIQASENAPALADQGRTAALNSK